MILTIEQYIDFYILVFFPPNFSLKSYLT